MKEETKVIHVPISTHTQITEYCKARGILLSFFVNGLITGFLNQTAQSSSVAKNNIVVPLAITASYHKPEVMPYSTLVPIAPKMALAPGETYTEPFSQE